MPPRSFIFRVAQVHLVITGTLLAIAWYFHEKDYADYFIERKGEYRSFQLQPANSSFRKSWLKITESGDRKPEAGDRRRETETGVTRSQNTQ